MSRFVPSVRAHGRIGDDSLWCTSLAAYVLDSDLAETTLLEVETDGARGVHGFDIVVEHPGVEHKLLVDPRLILGGRHVPMLAGRIPPAGRIVSPLTGPAWAR